MNINFLAAVRLNAALLPGMYERGTGTIIGISWAASFSPPPPVLHYACAKAALTTYTRRLAIKASPRGIRVNLVTPGNIITPGGDELRQTFIDSPCGGAPKPATSQFPWAGSANPRTSPRPSCSSPPTAPHESPRPSSSSTAVNSKPDSSRRGRHS
jgi:NAD(P)-dependent dehydrogenase (short-subunit alcohol dehydrogenase family)